MKALLLLMNAHWHAAARVFFAPPKFCSNRPSVQKKLDVQYKCKQRDKVLFSYSQIHLHMHMYCSTLTIGVEKFVKLSVMQPITQRVSLVCLIGRSTGRSIEQLVSFIAVSCRQKGFKLSSTYTYVDIQEYMCAWYTCS